MQLDRFPYEKIREEKLPTLSGNQKAHLHARKAWYWQGTAPCKERYCIETPSKGKSRTTKTFSKGCSIIICRPRSSVREKDIHCNHPSVT